MSRACSTGTSQALAGPPADAVGIKRGANGLDVFFGANLMLFVMMCAVTYYDRWAHFAGRSRPALAEFLFYALVLTLAITGLWVWLRRYTLPGWLLLVIEAGILAHFAGGLAQLDGTRLYDHVYLGIRYDKYVHVANAFIAALAVQEICRVKGQPLTGFTRLLVFFTVLGLGSIVEICEFAATLAIPRNGVGGYADTLGDLIANVCGGALFLAMPARLPLRPR